jgi:hypothetical protein
MSRGAMLNRQSAADLEKESRDWLQGKVLRLRNCTTIIAMMTHDLLCQRLFRLAFFLSSRCRAMLLQHDDDKSNWP